MGKERISGTEASRILGVSRPTVRAYHGKRLHPERTEKGYYVYDKKEVLEFAKWYRSKRPRFKKRGLTDGEKAREAFQEFERGSSVRDVVISLDVTPDVAKRWYRDWLLDTRGQMVEEVLTNVAAKDLELQTKATELQIKRTELAIRRKKDVRADMQLESAKERKRKRDEAQMPPEQDDGPPLVEQFMKGIAK